MGEGRTMQEQLSRVTQGAVTEGSAHQVEWPVAQQNSLDQIRSVPREKAIDWPQITQITQIKKDYFILGGYKLKCMVCGTAQY